MPYEFQLCITILAMLIAASTAAILRTIGGGENPYRFWAVWGLVLFAWSAYLLMEGAPQ